MKKTLQGSSLQKKLFHGTRPEIVDNICKENFDWRLSGKNATRYGQGSYFAQNASYSDSYATHKDDFTSRFMFLADVLVGSHVKGDSSMRRPPPKNPSNPTSDLYDSCVDDERKPEIFVVFENDQCYPSYVIEYTAVLRGCGATGGARYRRRYATGIQRSRASASSAATSARASQPSYGSSASSAAVSARASQPSYGSSASSAAVSARASQPSYGSSASSAVVSARASQTSYGSSTSSAVVSARASQPSYGSSASSAVVSARASQTSYGSSTSSAAVSARAPQPSFGSSASIAAVSARASQPSYVSSGVPGSSVYSTSSVGTPSYNTPSSSHTSSPTHQTPRSYGPVSGFSPPSVSASSGAVSGRGPTSSSHTGVDVGQSRIYSRPSTPSSNYPPISTRRDKRKCIVS